MRCKQFCFSSEDIYFSIQENQEFLPIIPKSKGLKVTSEKLYPEVMLKLSFKKSTDNTIFQKSPSHLLLCSSDQRATQRL
jgi:hypothetical protein